jgi:hypothetical protein
MSKRIAAIAAIAVLVAASAIAGSGQNHQVGTNSVMILPPRGQTSANAWATPVTYAQGDIVSHGSSLFWCQVAGGGANTSADTPAIEADGRSADGTNTWQWIPRGDRIIAAIVNDGSAAIYLNDRPAAVVGAGIRLNASGGVFNVPAGMMNTPLYAICGSASNSVAIFDR